MQDALTEDENTGGWAHLPSELLQRIAHLLAAAAGGHAQAETQLRLCCKHWRQSLPLGHSYAAKLWAWEPGAAAALGPHARHIDLMAPLPLPTPRVCPLLRVAHLPLRTLRLRHCAADALPALAELTTLEELDANVHFTGAHANWLAFAGELPGLRSLALRAAVVRLQPEEGLSALAPLRGRLARLRLQGAVLLTDTGAALLARLPGLARLEVSPSSLGQGGIDRLARALRSLTHVELQLHDGVAPQTLLLRGAEPAPAPAPPAGPAGPAPAAPAPAGGGAPPGSPRRVAAPLASLTAHVSRIKAPGLLEMVVHVAPGIRHLDVRQSGGTFLLAAPPSLLPLAGSLESLSLPGIQLPREVVAELGACTRLRRLGAELHYSVRDDALASWTALAALTNLDLHCNYYLTDAAVAALLAALPRLHDLALAQLQGSGAGLAPLAAMPRLRRLRLESCHLTDAAALAGALASAASLHVLSACGVQPDVCQAVAAAPPQLPELGELELLTALDLHFCGHSGPAPVAPAWARLEAAARLRHLHAASGLGWGGGALARACAAATGLRSLTLTDNAGVVGDEWLGGLGACTQLSKLNLGSCKGLTPAALGVLRQLSALTSFTAYRCPGLGRPDTVVAALREALPALCLATVHE
eukprot:scaffold9.g3147.t1